MMVHHTLKLKYRSRAEAVERALCDVLTGSEVSFEVRMYLPHWVTFKFSAQNKSWEELVAAIQHSIERAGLEHEFEECNS